MFATTFSKSSNGMYNLKVDLNVFEATQKWLINQQCQFEARRLQECGWFIITSASSGVIHRLDSRFGNRADVSNDNDLVKGSLEVLRKALNDHSFASIQKVTQHWTPDFKKVVWSALTLEERKAIHSLAASSSQSNDSVAEVEPEESTIQNNSASQPSLENTLNELQVGQIKKIVSLLKEVEILPKSLKLTSKKKEDLLPVILDLLPSKEKLVKASLVLVLENE